VGLGCLLAWIGDEVVPAAGTIGAVDLGATGRRRLADDPVPLDGREDGVRPGLLDRDVAGALGKRHLEGAVLEGAHVGRLSAAARRDRPATSLLDDEHHLGTRLHTEAVIAAGERGERVGHACRSRLHLGRSPRNWEERQSRYNRSGTHEMKKLHGPLRDLVPLRVARALPRIVIPL